MASAPPARLTLSNSLVALNTAAQGPDVLKSGGVTVAARFSLLGIGSGSGVSDGVNGNQVGSRAPRSTPARPAGRQRRPDPDARAAAGEPSDRCGLDSDCPATDQRGATPAGGSLRHRELRAPVEGLEERPGVFESVTKAATGAGRHGLRKNLAVSGAGLHGRPLCLPAQGAAR